MWFPKFFIAKLFLYFESSSAMQFGVYCEYHGMQQNYSCIWILTQPLHPTSVVNNIVYSMIIMKDYFFLLRILFVAANPIAEGKKSPFIHACTVSFIIFLFHMSLGRQISYILIMWLSSKMETTSLFLRWEKCGGREILHISINKNRGSSTLYQIVFTFPSLLIFQKIIIVVVVWATLIRNPLIFSYYYCFRSWNWEGIDKRKK